MSSQAPQSSVEVESTLDASLALSAPGAPTENATSIDEAVARVLSDPAVADDAGTKETEGPSNPRGQWDGGSSEASFPEPPRRRRVGEPCNTGDDCGRGADCGFAEAAHCAARGICMRGLVLPRGAACAPVSISILGCACDGTNVPAVCPGLPRGYYSKPLRYRGACMDGGPAAVKKLTACTASCNGDLMCLMKCQHQ